MNTIRRSTTPSHSSTSNLDAVPEYGATSLPLLLPSSRLSPAINSPINSEGGPSRNRNLNTNRSSIIQPSTGRHDKGKMRAISPVPTITTTPAPSIDGEARSSEWVVDPVAARRGLDVWSRSDRIILVVGSPTTNTLAPLLYDPAYSDTLLLIATPEPLPSIENLLSTPNTPDKTIYPTLRTLNRPAAFEGANPLPALLEEAISVAKAYRSPGRVTNSKWSPKRLSSYALPDTPPRSPKLGPSSLAPFSLRSMTRKGSKSSLHEEGLIERPPSVLRPSSMAEGMMSQSSLPRNKSETIMSGTGSNRSSFSSWSLPRLRSDDEETDKLVRPRLASTTSASRSGSGGSPFDAVINFIPPSSNFQPQRAMQEMLQHSFVLTTGIFPLFMLRPAGTGRQEEEPQLSLVHVLPSKVPGPLPDILEDFTLSLSSPIKRRGQRNIWAGVVTSSIWTTPSPEYKNMTPPSLTEFERISGAGMLLSGAVQCINKRTGQKASRCFLPSWRLCVERPNTLNCLHDTKTELEQFTFTPSQPGLAFRPSYIGSSPGLASEVRSQGYSAHQIDERAPSTPELVGSSRSSTSDSDPGSGSGSGGIDHSTRSGTMSPTSRGGSLGNSPEMELEAQDFGMAVQKEPKTAGTLSGMKHGIGNLSKGFKRFVSVRKR